MFRMKGLTQERLHEVLSYEPNTGDFRWKVLHKCSNFNVGDFAVLNEIPR